MFTVLLGSNESVQSRKAVGGVKAALLCVTELDCWGDFFRKNEPHPDRKPTHSDASGGDYCY